MQDINIKNINEYLGKEVRISGWVYNFRSSGKIMFLQIRDGSGFVQAVLEKSSVDERVWNEAEDITLETSLRVYGLVKKHPKKDEYEIEVKDIEIVSISQEYPIGKKEHGPDFLLDHRHLWVRSRRQWAILRIRAGIYRLIEEFLEKNGFTRFDSPIFTPSACEGTTTLFGVDYFDLGQAFLSQSGQLYLEAGIYSLGRVYDFGPVFRAEKSKTRRHLTEFWMMDAEAAFMTHEENIKIQEDLVYYIVSNILDNYTYELSLLERDIKPLEEVKPPFIRMTHKEAVDELRKLGSDIDYMDDLGGDDETILTKQYSKPIFIEKYPKDVKAFYMKEDPEDKRYVLCDDLLAPEGYGEIIGGSQREDDYNKLLERIREHDLPEEDFRWYLDLRKYGSVPHSGFGIGLERVVAWICGLKHVRETIPFPRMIYRKRP